MFLAPNLYWMMCVFRLDGWRLAQEETSTGKIVYKKPLTLKITIG